MLRLRGVSLADQQNRGNAIGLTIRSKQVMINPDQGVDDS